MSPREKTQFENRKLSNELDKKNTLYNNLKNTFTHTKNTLSKFFLSNTEFLTKIKSIENFARKGESKDDAVRNLKLTKLINKKSSINYTKVKLINLTDILYL